MIDLAPEMESRIREYAEAEGVSLNELIARHFPQRLPLAEEDSDARVQSLLLAWQREYGLPIPAGGYRHSLADLFADWEAEDANLTPEQVADEQQFWEEHSQRERQSISI